MKYLKLFEDVNEFQEINQDEFISMIFNTHYDSDDEDGEGVPTDEIMVDDMVDDISKSEVIEIKNILNRNFRFQLNKNYTNKNYELRIEDSRGYLIYNISKSVDEWFFVEFLFREITRPSNIYNHGRRLARLAGHRQMPGHNTIRKYYKCDQLFGLLDCLKLTERMT